MITLTEQESELLAKIEKYKTDGYYNVYRMNQELSGMSEMAASWADLFGDCDDSEVKSPDLPEIILAKKINRALDEEKKAATIRETNEIRGRVESQSSTLEDHKKLVAAGLAYWVYDDPESNGPTGVIISLDGFGDKNPYADQRD